MSQPRLSIGEVATQAGVNVETLRYYERRGLLKEPPRHLSGHRQYPPDAVDFIRSIKQAQSLGFTLDEIEELIAVAERRPARSGEALVAGAERKLGEVDQKIAALHAMRAGLEAIVEQRCDSLVSCSCGRGCPVGPSPERRAAVATTLPPVEPLPGSEEPETDSQSDSPSGPLAIHIHRTSGRVRGRMLTFVPLALIACLACFLPALIAGGLALGGAGLLSAVDAPADLSLAAIGAALGVAGTLAATSLRARRFGTAC